MNYENLHKKGYSFEELLKQYNYLIDEYWNIRKSDGILYREIILGKGLSDSLTIVVEHSLDDVPLIDLYCERSNLIAIQKENGNFILFKSRWKPIDLFDSDEGCLHKEKLFSSLPKSLLRTQEDLQQIQELIKHALYYYVYNTLYDYNFFNGIPSCYQFEGELITPILASYKEYLGLVNIEMDKLLNLGNLEGTKSTYRKTLGTIYDTQEIKYFFYILYLHIDLGLFSLKEIVSLGRELGYSEESVEKYIEEIKWLKKSPESSVKDSMLIQFKKSITKPYKRIPPISRMHSIRSVHCNYCGIEDYVDYGNATDWSLYETMGYWNIDNEYKRGAFDDDLESYWNID